MIKSEIVKLYNNRCLSGQHDLVQIFKVGSENEETIINWCRICGVVVGDLGVDGRIIKPGGMFGMRSPLIYHIVSQG